MKRSPLLPIFLIVLADILGLTIILPLLPFYAEKLGASPTEVGLLVSTYAFCQLLSGLYMAEEAEAGLLLGFQVSGAGAVEEVISRAGPPVVVPDG